MHAPGGIRTHNPSKRAAVDARLKPLVKDLLNQNVYSLAYKSLKLTTKHYYYYYLFIILLVSGRGNRLNLLKGMRLLKFLENSFSVLVVILY